MIKKRCKAKNDDSGCHKTYGGQVYWYLLSFNFWCSDLYGTAKVNPWSLQNRKNEEF